ncbi:tyrosine-protein phosphatase non-receptor type 61F isoform X1 [Sabethes cyaneus]|uniref:tyrosine-protein phosphatase non-receptor type 61F isoform X1 n=1 Tax=Sabethes cyaneus TaxID=53552 RepID=UPI00221E2EF5|nr:tyrosine-protein phosphatase non-receptor type 61F isoform X1 [Sabethes cyaneus]
MSSNNTTSSSTTSSSSGGGTNSIEAEYNDIESRKAWCTVFQEIREKSEQEARQKVFSTDESKKLDNRRLNRYRDVSPYDHSRIVLKRGETDYINANLVKMDRADRKYILCQGPLPLTVGHFWLMVWEYNSRAILMLNKLIEKKQIKCHLYWPEKMGEEHKLELPEVQLAIEYLKCVEYKNFCKRTFRVTDLESSKSREVVQFHYTTWPDFGIPSSPVAFLQFLKEVRDSGALDKDVGPPIIHCSAGIGRSGTFCLVDCCLVLIDKEGENKVSVQDVLLELRQYRMGLIQTVDQLYFSYQAIIEGMKRMNNSSLEDFEELSVVVASSQPTSDQDTENDDTPPPLPPPRSHSLTITQKPLPLIPNSESVHEDFITCQERDMVNNLMNLEKSKQYEISKDRPLPPLPKESPLDKVREANSSDDSGASGSSGSEADDLIEEIDTEEENGEDDEQNNSDNIESSVLDETTITSSSSPMTTTTTSAAATAASSNTSTLESNRGGTAAEKSFDANATLPPVPNGVDGNSASAGEESISSPEREMSPNAELRRRKRLERQTAMEEKIREIKRKQKEVENKASPKKRRSLFLTIAAAGVCIGVLCVYLYTRNM